VVLSAESSKKMSLPQKALNSNPVLLKALAVPAIGEKMEKSALAFCTGEIWGSERAIIGRLTVAGVAATLFNLRYLSCTAWTLLSEGQRVSHSPSIGLMQISSRE
jgi:hypothetical protein